MDTMIDKAGITPGEVVKPKAEIIVQKDRVGEPYGLIHAPGIIAKLDELEILRLLSNKDKTGEPPLTQPEIADKLGISGKTVEKKLLCLRERSKNGSEIPSLVSVAVAAEKAGMFDPYFLMGAESIIKDKIAAGEHLLKEDPFVENNSGVKLKPSELELLYLISKGVKSKAADHLVGITDQKHMEMINAMSERNMHLIDNAHRSNRAVVLCGLAERAGLFDKFREAEQKTNGVKATIKDQ